MRKSKLTVPELAKRAGVSESWIKAVKTGRIDRPLPDRLRAVAAETGGDLETLLALSNQLGAASTASPAAGDASGLAALIAQLGEQNRLIGELVAQNRELIDRLLPTPDPERDRARREAEDFEAAEQPRTPSELPSPNRRRAVEERRRAVRP